MLGDKLGFEVRKQTKIMFWLIVIKLKINTLQSGYRLHSKKLFC